MGKVRVYSFFSFEVWWGVIFCLFISGFYLFTQLELHLVVRCWCGWAFSNSSFVFRKKKRKCFRQFATAAGSCRILQATALCVDSCWIHLELLLKWQNHEGNEGCTQIYSLRALVVYAQGFCSAVFYAAGSPTRRQTENCFAHWWFVDSGHPFGLAHKQNSALWQTEHGTRKNATPWCLTDSLAWNPGKTTTLAALTFTWMARSGYDNQKGCFQEIIGR